MCRDCHVKDLVPLSIPCVVQGEAGEGAPLRPSVRGEHSAGEVAPLRPSVRGEHSQLVRENLSDPQSEVSTQLVKEHLSDPQSEVNIEPFTSYVCVLYVLCVGLQLVEGGGGAGLQDVRGPQATDHITHTDT